MKKIWDLKDHLTYKVQNTMYNVMNENNPLKSFKSLT